MGAVVRERASTIAKVRALLAKTTENGATEAEVLATGRILGYSRNTAYEAAVRGELPTIRLGRKIRVPRVALQRLLDGVVPKTSAE